MIILRCQLDAVRLHVAPIHSLPNELLSHIIRSACTTVSQPPPHTPTGSKVLLLIPPPASKFSETPKFSASAATILSLVCKRWRIVALSDIVLWSDIDISQRRPIKQDFYHTFYHTFYDALRWAVTCLTRSDPLPVSISVSNCTRDPMAMIGIVHLINDNGQRIRELKAFLRMTGSLLNDFSQLQSPMPNLEVLEIGCSPHPGTPPGTALPQIFSQNYPRLKHLSIQHFTSTPPQAFKNLVTLTLSYSHGRVSIDDFLALVVDSPRLEVLWIKRYLINRSASPHPPVPVSLTRLSSITLENCDSHLILCALRVPNTATLRIMYPMHYLGRRPRNAITDAFPLDSTIVGPLDSARELSYGADGTTVVFVLKDSQGDVLVHVEQGQTAPDLASSPLASRYNAFLKTNFHDIFALEQAAGLLGSLTTLELDLRGLPNHHLGGSRLSFWLAFFEGTPRLEVLRASYLYTPAMMDGLNPSNNPTRKVFCPALRTLQLDIRSGAFDLKNDWLLQVVDATRWRGKRGSPFRDVSVYLMSSGYGHDFTLPSDAVQAMFSLRDAGVENMSFSNGTTTYRFGESLLYISARRIYGSHTPCCR